MKYLFLALFSLSGFAQTQYGSNDRPKPFYADAFSRTAVSYEAYDWRNQGGVNWLGPIRDQANCGSCVAFATIATLEDQLTISTRSLWKKEAFSQEALFSCGRAKCSSGWFIFDAAKTVERLGVVDVACAPYAAGAAGKVSVCANFCENQMGRTLKINSLTHPVGAAAVKEALKRGPLATTMSIRKGFDGYKGGIFKSTIDDDILGGHAVELVGYNDLERYWIIKNSWGEFWGEKGFARISYDDAQGVGSDTYGFNVNPESEGFELPLEDQYIQGPFLIKGRLSIVEIMKGITSVAKLDCSQGCNVDSTKLSDGVYTISSAGSSGRSMTRRITILNHVVNPIMTLSNPPSWNYSYPQSGRIYFDIGLSGEIFPEMIVMQLKQGNSVVYQRVFRDVYAFNRIGFNTGALANGSYDVFFNYRTLDKSSSSQSVKITIKN